MAPTCAMVCARAYGPFGFDSDFADASMLASGELKRFGPPLPEMPIALFLFLNADDVQLPVSCFEIAASTAGSTPYFLPISTKDFARCFACGGSIDSSF